MDMKAINRRVIEQFRSGGEIDGMHRDRILLLTTTGARSGRAHTAPMMFVPDGDRLLVIASNMGAEKDPDWYRNVCAHPHVTVEIDDDSFDAVGRALTGDEYERLWADIKKSYPFFADHEAQVARVIPVLSLTRVKDGGGQVASPGDPPAEGTN